MRGLSLLLLVLSLTSCRPTSSLPTPKSSQPPETTSQPVDFPLGSLQPGNLFSNVLGKDFDYQVYLPAGYDNSTQRYPTIYLLHGRGDSYYSWQIIQTDLDQLIAAGRVSPLIAILPDVPANKRASYFVDSGYRLEPIQGGKVETAFVQDLIPHIDATYRTIPTRSARAIAGYSMGGYAATRYPLAHPELFSAAIILSPAVYFPLPPSDSSARQFGAFGNEEVIFDEAIYKEKNYPALLPAFENARLPFYAYIAVGDDEWRNPAPEDYEHDLDFEAARLYNKLVHTPYVVAQFRVMNGGHDWDVWRPAFIEGVSWISRFLNTSQ